MDFIFGVISGFASLILFIDIFNTLIRKRKFKVGDIIVPESSEEWDENRYEYKINEIGNYKYKISSIGRIYGRGMLNDTLPFDQESDWRVK